jgi:hypothetical protein
MTPRFAAGVFIALLLSSVSVRAQNRDLVKLHDERLSNLGADKYFACVEMNGVDGKIYDVDFLMVVKPR